MTTIILTIIGILLAAAAALMVIFYGGDAFNSGTVGAQANQFQNAGTNVVSAVQMFKAESATAPTVIGDLTATANRPNGAYLDEEPALPSGLSGLLETAGTPARQLYVVENVPAAVCDRINSNLKNLAANVVAATPVAARTQAVTGGVKMGCYASAPATIGTFIARA